MEKLNVAKMSNDTDWLLNSILKKNKVEQNF